ncbi:MAG TPA: hypothetical protein VN643_06060 [Pyrinomonadaceae bacterium]|nr:hypothetical protein [Pyrinomonadaceae bacterium]
MKARSRLTTALLLTLTLFAHSLSFAQSPPPCPYPGTPTKSPDCHPYPQPLLTPSIVTRSGDTFIIKTGESLFPQPAIDPFTLPPGTNFLPTIYTNMFDSQGNEMVNTLPSTPNIPYNLHDGDPVVSQINDISPTDDLRTILERVINLSAQAKRGSPQEEPIYKAIQMGIDVLEGNPVPERSYSGFPVLHYTGPDKGKVVTPIYDDSGKNVIGGNVNIHQIWYDSHIESDAAFIDPSAVLNVPWTVTYTLDVLNRGEDDFSPFAIYVDPTAAGPVPHIGMDQTFFPMENGTRTVLKIKMPPAKYLNMTYTWGWRMHPPRIQVTDNALKKISVNGGKPMTLPQWEQSVFCPPENPKCSPKGSEALKVRAIGMIGDYAPEKQMWLALREARQAARQANYPLVIAKAKEAQDSFFDWTDRTKLPSTGKYKVEVDKDSDLTLLYVNNTIYAEFSDRSNDIDDAIRIDFTRWKLRGTTLKVTIYNGDNFDHGYMNVDFGGARGWENQFKSSVKVGGSGCWFTFGRAHWWANIPNTPKTPNNPAGDLMVVVPAANKEPYKASVRKVHITYNYEPSRRLRFYQFDPLHHDVAIFSVH